MPDKNTVIVATTLNSPAGGAKAIELLFEAVPPPGMPMPMAGTGPISRLDKNFEDITRSVGDLIASSFANFFDVMNKMNASEVKVTIGVKLTAEAGILITKTAAEGTFEVEMLFKKGK